MISNQKRARPPLLPKRLTRKQVEAQTNSYRFNGLLITNSFRNKKGYDENYWPLQGFSEIELSGIPQSQAIPA